MAGTVARATPTLGGLSKPPADATVGPSQLNDANLPTLTDDERWRNPGIGLRSGHDGLEECALRTGIDQLHHADLVLVPGKHGSEVNPDLQNGIISLISLTRTIGSQPELCRADSRGVA